MTSSFPTSRGLPTPDYSDSTHWYGAQRFGRTAQYFHHYQTSDTPGSRPSGDEHGDRFESFVTPQALLRSISLAYALNASNLMYDVISYFKVAWTEPGITSSHEGKILSVASLIPGSGVGYFVLALFCAWAAMSAGLGQWYWFRRRLANRVDGHMMVRKDADMAEELKLNEEFMSGKLYQNSGTLAALPGNILSAKG